MAEDDPHERRDQLELLRRWELAGGTWQVVGASSSGLTISLRTCAADEEMDRFTTADPAVVAFVRAGGDEAADATDRDDPDRRRL